MNDSKIGIKKKILFYFTLTALLYLFSEVLAFTGYYIIKHQFFSWDQYQVKRLEIMQSKVSQGEKSIINKNIGEVQIEENKERVQVIHPYLGYVLDPRMGNGISEYGFPGDDKIAPISKKNDNNIIIGIFGGSFAVGFSNQAKEVLVQELQRVPQFRNKALIIHAVALGGYKQPQQLIALTYFLSLGAHFDIVINLDGFNEVVLPAYENVPKQVFPFFPRNWFARVNNFSDSAMLQMIGKIAYLNEKRQEWARPFSQSPLQYNIIGNLIWEYYDNRLANQRVAQEMAFNKYDIKGRENLHYLVTGPSFYYATETELYEDSAQVWQRCSEQMHHLCTANGIEYFHFLQPNQYVPHSKILRGCAKIT